MATPCWEFEKCGKQHSCPAYPESGFQCWTVSGTLCRGQSQGNYDEKIHDCRVKCEYYNGVMAGSISVT